MWRIGEPAIVCLLLLLFTLAVAPLFRSFFIGEDLGLWLQLQHPDVATMKLVFLPHSLFWRPFASFCFLLSAILLPLDPFVFHLRNYCVTVASAIVLYLILRRLVHSPIARITGLAFFVISKVHLTTIGCIEMLDSLLALFSSLVAVYGTILFLQTGRRRFLGAAVIFFVFAVFSRDYAVGLIVVIALLVYAYVRPRSTLKSWLESARPVAPFVVIAAAYICVRLVMQTRTAMPSSGNYAPVVDLQRIMTHAGLFAGDIFNAAFVNPHIHGTGSLFGLLGLPRWADMGFVALGSVLLAAAVWLRWREATMWSFVALGFLFIAPTFLVALTQTYYILTPVAGIAVALGIALDGSRRAIGALRISWAVVLLITAANGYLMRQNWKTLWWATAAADVRKTYEEVLSHETDPQLRRLTLIVDDAGTRGYLYWALNPFNGSGLVQALTGNPKLELVVDIPKQVNIAPDHLSDHSAVYLARGGHFTKVVPFRIEAAGPTEVKTGQRFNTQPSGESAMWLQTENVPPSAVVKLGSSTVPSAYASPMMMSATIPSSILDKPGVYPVWIEDAVTGMRSNSIQLTVRSNRRD